MSAILFLNDLDVEDCGYPDVCRVYPNNEKLKNQKGPDVLADIKQRTMLFLS